MTTSFPISIKDFDRSNQDENKIKYIQNALEQIMNEVEAIETHLAFLRDDALGNVYEEEGQYYIDSSLSESIEGLQTKAAILNGMPTSYNNCIMVPKVARYYWKYSNLDLDDPQAALGLVGDHPFLNSFPQHYCLGAFVKMQDTLQSSGAATISITNGESIELFDGAAFNGEQFQGSLCGWQDTSPYAMSGEGTLYVNIGTAPITAGSFYLFYFYLDIELGAS